MTGSPSVIITGAGIVGATLAYHLASGGASVTIIERSRPASGVTARSFAWINVIHGNAPDLMKEVAAREAKNRFSATCSMSRRARPCA